MEYNYYSLSPTNCNCNYSNTYQLQLQLSEHLPIAIPITRTLTNYNCNYLKTYQLQLQLPEHLPIAIAIIIISEINNFDLLKINTCTNTIHEEPTIYINRLSIYKGCCNNLVGVVPTKSHSSTLCEWTPLHRT